MIARLAAAEEAAACARGAAPQATAEAAAAQWWAHAAAFAATLNPGEGPQAPCPPPRPCEILPAPHVLSVSLSEARFSATIVNNMDDLPELP